MPGDDDVSAIKIYLQTLADWDQIVYDLSHLPIIWDDEVAKVVDNGWRSATPEEIERISQVFIEALVANIGEKT